MIAKNVFNFDLQMAVFQFLYVINSLTHTSVVIVDDFHGILAQIHQESQSTLTTVVTVLSLKHFGQRHQNHVTNPLTNQLYSSL